MLRAARETGIVEIRIKGIVSRSEHLEKLLSNRFNLRRAMVSESHPNHSDFENVSKLGAEIFQEEAAEANLVAVSWGTTLQAVVEQLPYLDHHSSEVTQLVGGLVSFDTQATAHDLVKELGQKFGTRYHYLNCPAVFDSAEALRYLMAEAAVSETLEMARRTDVALVGIGSPSLGSSAKLLDLLKLSPAEEKELWSQNPVGDICGRYYDLQGIPLSWSPLHDRILALEIEDLRAIPTVIGVAYGIMKAAAVVGALRAELIDVLVCDDKLAQAILDFDAEPQSVQNHMWPISDVPDINTPEKVRHQKQAREKTLRSY